MPGPQYRKTRAEREADEKSSAEENAKAASLIAKKDFEIHHNEYHREIKAGDDLSDVPEMYLENLKTEGVL